MNCFRKKSTAFLTLESLDFNGDAQKLWANLRAAVQGQAIRQVTLRVYDSGDLPLRVTGLIVAFACQLQAENIALRLEASGKLLQILRRLNLSSPFFQTAEVN